MGRAKKPRDEMKIVMATRAIVPITNERNDQKKAMKIYATAIQLRREVIRSRTPAQEKKGLPNQSEMTAKSLFRIAFALLTSNRATNSIAVSRARKMRTARGKIAPLENPKAVSAARALKMGNVVTR